MLTVPVADCAGLAESVTFTVNVDVPAVVGVPVTAQFAPRLSPAGREPEVIAQLYGDVPPLAPIVAEYGVPTVPPGSVPVVIVSAAGAIVMLTVPIADCAGLPESVTFTVTVEVPAVVGVPVTAQFVPRVRPAGSVPAVIEQLYGEVPPLAPIVAEYGVPTVPPGSVPVVMVTAAGAMVMLTVPVAVPAGLAESVTFTVSVEVPAVVGVPVTPQLAPSVRPAGSVPAVIEQLYGEVPPLAPIVAE